MTKPLEGYRIIELAGIGPGPYAGQLLADMGAEIILINRPGPMANIPAISNRGKKTMVLDLRKPEGVAIVLDLIKSADVLFEGLRPGVTERLGLGPDACQAVNPKLIYGRMTGWGQSGPWAKTAGHDINYISITGALGAMGAPGTPPMPPLNLVGDYGGGTMFLVTGILAALLKAEKTGKGEVVDAAMIDGVSSLMGMFHSMAGIGQWNPERGTNLLDGAKPYYRCYETSDGKYMAVGCIEPQFFAIMLDKLGITPEAYGGQNDKSQFEAQCALLETTFAHKSRDEWAEIFYGTDACVSPILTYDEAADHPQNKARGGLKKQGNFTHPRTAPVFMSQIDDEPFHIPGGNDDADAVLKALGYDDAKIESLRADGITPA
ncbi:MAG: CaiB/BaiF CoA transferase family protein [Maricaulaceae bacterium]